LAKDKDSSQSVQSPKAKNKSASRTEVSYASTNPMQTSINKSGGERLHNCRFLVLMKFLIGLIYGENH